MTSRSLGRGPAAEPADRTSMLRRMRRALLPLAFLGAGIAVSFGLFATQPTATPTTIDERVRPVAVMHVELEPYVLGVTAHGAVAPRREIQLVSEVEGRVTWLSDAYAAGGSFEAGAVLLRLDETDYADRLREAEAEVALAHAEAREARADLGREQRLASNDIASASRLGDAETRRDVAGARLQRARARLQRAKRDLERTRIVAPWPGRVREKFVDVGQFVRRGSDLGRIFATDFAEVRLSVPTRSLGDLDIPPTALAGAVLEAGPSVTLTGRLGQDVHAWKARITRVEAALDQSSRTATLVARVDDPYGGGVSEAGLPLLIGLFVEARITGRALAQAIRLPRSAFDGRRVGLVEDGRLSFRDVEVAAWEHDVAVVASGLSPGEVVCTDLPAGAIEGMRVAALEPIRPDAVVSAGTAP